MVTACEKEEEDDSIATVEVVNGYDFTLRDLGVRHLNDDDEVVRSEALGDLSVGKSITFTTTHPKIYLSVNDGGVTKFTANETLRMGKKTTITLNSQTYWYK